GARGDHLPLGGTIDTPININQLDPKYQSLGPALNQALPNPFFGVAVAGPLATQATLTRAQLLRPYPQFSNVLDRQVSEGRNRYNAGVIEWSKRVSHGWGGRISYTYSVLKDNQIGEANFFSTPNCGTTGGCSGTSSALNNYNYVASMPACAPGAQLSTACFDPMVDYAYGILDVPHRVIIAPVVELPFGRGKKWGNESAFADYLAGGWSAAAVVNLQ